MSTIKSKNATFRLRQLYTLGFWPRALALLASLAFIAVAPLCYASNGETVQMPLTRSGTPAYSIQSGLQIKVDSTWAGNRGYRPVNVTVSMLKPAAADTLLTINFCAGNWQNDHRGICVEHDFELLMGSTNTTATFSVPQYVDWNSTSWKVWVDGVKDEQLCSLRGYSAGTSGAVAVGVFTTARWSWSADPSQLLQSIFSSNIDEHIYDVSSLPDQWIDYSPLDVFVSTTSSLELLRVSSPEKLTVLLRWVRAGGNLWILNVGTDSSKLPELEKLLLPDLGEQAETESVLPSNWHFLKPNENGRPRLNELASMTMQIPDEEDFNSRFDSRESDDFNLTDAPEQWHQLFVARNYGLGTVVAWRNTHGFEEFGLFGGASITQNLDWATRHGNDPAGGNPNFNNLLIPDVGAAPVFEFQLLISLFVIGIGPVNYWLLKRSNRLPLLLVTVPLAALAATLLLFTYGFLSDGIGVRVRVRSMTMLDQRVGEVASWARLSYYAGIAPSDGLQMPVDTTVYPILPSRSGNNSFGRRHINQQRSVEWDSQQQLTRGWLGSRTPTQYLAITARPTKKHLQFVAEAEQLFVTNHLDTQVLALVVQDQEGNIFVGDSIDAAGHAKLAPSNYINASSKIRRLRAENLPQLPAGYVESKRSRRRRFSGGNYGVSMTESLMELQLEAMVSPLATGWGNGTYLAITATGIEVALGVEDVSETSSFHVVRGTW